MERFQLTVEALWDVGGWVLVGTAVVALLGTLFLRSQRRAAELASDGWVWTLNGFYLAVLVWTYLSGPNDIRWWLATSADRVTLPVLLLFAVSCAGWVAVAFGDDRRAEPQPVRDEPREPAMSGAGPEATG
ncbi:hypothetical protein NKG94_30180 [Micromonospora sp. M12]